MFRVCSRTDFYPYINLTRIWLTQGWLNVNLVDWLNLTDSTLEWIIIAFLWFFTRKWFTNASFYFHDLLDKLSLNLELFKRLPSCQGSIDLDFIKRQHFNIQTFFLRKSVIKIWVKNNNNKKPSWIAAIMASLTLMLPDAFTTNTSKFE